MSKQRNELVINEKNIGLLSALRAAKEVIRLIYAKPVKVRAETPVLGPSTFRTEIN